MSYEPSIEMRELLDDLQKLIDGWRVIANQAAYGEGMLASDTIKRDYLSCAKELHTTIKPYLVDDA